MRRRGTGAGKRQVEIVSFVSLFNRAHKLDRWGSSQNQHVQGSLRFGAGLRNFEPNWTTTTHERQSFQSFSPHAPSQHNVSTISRPVHCRKAMAPQACQANLQLVLQRCRIQEARPEVRNFHLPRKLVAYVRQLEHG